MADLNINNFIRWNGGWNPKPYTLSAFSYIENLFANEDSLVTNPLSACTASNGIDTTSFKILSIVDSVGNPVTLQQECQWDGVSVLTVYRPTNLSLTIFFINFTFSD